jgi:predicted aldo/keto reductase-like oxidoreductase
MLYRPLGRTGVDVSVLGFGCMRLPVIDHKPDQIDYPKAAELLHYAIEHGVNYVDTAYFYHGVNFGAAGASEPFLGEALSGGWRDRVNLATKLPVGLVRERADMDRLLAEQLERLKTDRLDFYLLHGLSGESWARVRDLGVIEFLESARDRGLIRFPAFSFHGKAEDFVRICDEYDDWAFGQIQYNYMDIGFQAGYSGLRHAADKGMGVVVMEPLKGGKLAANLPAELDGIFSAREEGWTPAEWALRFVWNESGVSMLLSGMNEIDQLAENLRVAEQASADSLTTDQLSVYGSARLALAERIKADCTACRYCMPCASGVDIPDVLAALNNAAMWEDSNAWLTGYTAVKGKANLCSACGACEGVCPQGLPIPQLMKDAVETFGQ